MGFIVGKIWKQIIYGEETDTWMEGVFLVLCGIYS